MMDNPYDYPTLNTREKRVIRLVAVAVGLVLCALASAGWAYVRLTFYGWHPIPETALGCTLHKRFHSVQGDRLRRGLLNSDCLSAQISGEGKVLRSQQTLQRVRAWFDARSDLWFEGFLLSEWPSSRTYIELRGCTDRPDVYATVGDDWITYSVEDWRRPICRNEWRELAAILKEGN